MCGHLTCRSAAPAPPALIARTCHTTCHTACNMPPGRQRATWHATCHTACNVPPAPRRESRGPTRCLSHTRVSARVHVIARSSASVRVHGFTARMQRGCDRTPRSPPLDGSQPRHVRPSAGAARLSTDGVARPALPVAPTLAGRPCRARWRRSRPGRRTCCSPRFLRWRRTARSLCQVAVTGAAWDPALRERRWDRRWVDRSAARWGVGSAAQMAKQSLYLKETPMQPSV